MGNIILLTILFGIGITIGIWGLVDSLESNEYRTKQPLTPTIEVKCINNVCDTTYIYKID